MVPPAALALQSRYRASRVLLARAEDTALFIERIFLCVAKMSANDEIVTIMDNICDRTHFVRVQDTQAMGRGKWLAEEVIWVIAALGSDDRDEAAIRIDRFLQRQIDRLPDIMPKALAAMFVDELNPSWFRRDP